MTHQTRGAALLALLALPALLAASALPAVAQTPIPRAVPPAAARTLSLEEAMAIAERQSEAVRIAQAGVQRATGQQTQARSAYYPQLNGSLSYQKTLQSQFEAISKAAGAAAGSGSTGGTGGTGGTDSSGSGGAGSLADNPLAKIFASKNTMIFGLTGSWTVFSGGRVQAQNGAAAAGRRAAQTGVTAQRAQVKLDVAQAYYDAVLADRMVTIAESSFVQSERAVRQTQLARNVGNISEFELLRAQVTRDNQRPQVIGAREQRQTAYYRLAQLLDIPLSTPLALTDRLPDADPPAAIVAAAQAQSAGQPVRPVSMTVDVDALLADDASVTAAVDSVIATADTSADDRAPVRQAKENVVAQRQALKAVRGERLPSVGLSSTYQRYAYPTTGLPSGWDQTFPNWTVALGINVPIFTGGRIKGEEQVARANLTEAEQRLEQAREFASLDASVAVAELTRATAAYNASAGTAQVASRAYTIADVRYREGLSTQLELSDTRVQLAQAQASRAQAARNLQVARLKLALIRDLPLAAGTSAATDATTQQQQQGTGASSDAAGTQTQPQTQTQPGTQSAGTSQQAGSTGGQN